MAMKSESKVQVKDVQFEGNILRIVLSDGREIGLPIDQMNWLKWLAKATPEKRAKWFCHLLGRT